MLVPVRAEAVLPDRTLCLPTFSHFLIVNKTLSLSGAAAVREHILYENTFHVGTLST